MSVFLDDCTGTDPLDKWDIVSGSTTLSYKANAAYTALFYSVWPYYRGAWSTGPANTRPMAHYAAGKTFFAFINGQSPAWACVGCYDHASGAVTGVTKIMQLSMADGHLNPSVLVTSTGKVMVFVSSHGGSSKVFRSTTAHSIDSFIEVAPIPGGTTYPSPIELTAGTIRAFHRQNDQGYSYVYSTNEGDSWSSVFQVVTGSAEKRTYCIIEPNGSQAHVAWAVLDQAAQLRTDIRYAIGNGAQNWFGAALNPLAVPINNLTGGDLVFDSGTDQVSTPQDMLCCPLSPVIPFILLSHGTIGGTWTWRVARWTGTAWVNSIVATGDRQFDHGCLIWRDDKLIALLPSGPAQPGHDGGLIEEWESTDAVTWTKTVTHSDTVNSNFVKRVRNGLPAFEALWSRGNAITGADCETRMLGSEGGAALRPGNPFYRWLEVTGPGVIRPKGTTTEISVSAGGMKIDRFTTG